MVFSHKKMQVHSFFLGQVLLCQNTTEFNKPVVLGITPSYSYSRPPSHLQTVSVKGGIHFILNTTKMLTFEEQGITTPKRNGECSKGKLCVLEKVVLGGAAQRRSGALIFLPGMEAPGTSPSPHPANSISSHAYWAQDPEL